MNLAAVDQIAKAVLYEGYLLYPYRPSSVKNRQRFNFGVLYPKVYSDAQGGAEPSAMQSECLVRGNAETVLEIRVRFLQLRMEKPDSAPYGWHEAFDREVSVPRHTLEELSAGSAEHKFVFSVQNPDGCLANSVEAGLTGTIVVSAEKVREDAFKLRIRIGNMTAPEFPCSRDEALTRSMVSTHAILGVEDGEFVSLLEPPDALREVATQCHNTGWWPVLVGGPGERDTVLVSPIILYDYAQIAPESSGDLFDGTEIDEILSLRIMTLTDEEKAEIRRSDARAREILDRTESMPAEQFMKLHGAVRSLTPVNPRPTKSEPLSPLPLQENAR